MKEIQSVGIAGSGTMGAGIAQVAALSGFTTKVFDISEDALERAKASIDRSMDVAIQKGKISESDKNKALRRLSFHSKADEVVADIIIEAIVEKLEPKVELFKKLAEVNSPDTILATNTSSIPVTRIAARLPNPERVVGMHFFNPAPVMKLVEVISGAATSSEVADAVFDLSLKMGKVPVRVKDSPGFIVNRVARHFYVEALKMLEEGVASVETIDALAEASGFKMGPFKLMDLIGVDVNYSVTTAMFESFHYDGKFRPSRIQQQKVEAGHLGRKSGKGFYNYD